MGFSLKKIDYVLSLNNSNFGDYVDRIYPIELEIKDTTDTDTTDTASTSRNGQWGTIKNETLQQKSGFQFSHWKRSSYMSQHASNTSICSHIFQLLLYSKASGSFQYLLDRGLLLKRKLLNLWLSWNNALLRKRYGSHHDLDNRCGIYVLQITREMFRL